MFRARCNNFILDMAFGPILHAMIYATAAV